MNKEIVFKNIVLCIRDWYEADKATLEKNDLSILKIFKLLFFIVCDSPKLMEYFDFHCQPYGHQDKELMNLVKHKNDFGFFKLGHHSTEFRDIEIDFPLSIAINNEIVKRIQTIKKLNPDFIKMSSFDLIDLNKYHYCYRYYYNPAYKKGVYDIHCPKEMILKDYKMYNNNIWI